jgi:predicted nuclease with RNAse H fold
MALAHWKKLDRKIKKEEIKTDAKHALIMASETFN